MLRPQFTIRTSSVADRYLKAVDHYCSDDLSHLYSIAPPSSSSHWNKEEKEEAQLSFSGTASMSSSSRTPTPVRGPSRASWQSRSIARSPYPMAKSTATTRDVTNTDASRSPRRIRLFPETSPPVGGSRHCYGGGVHAVVTDDTDGASVSLIMQRRRSRTGETRNPPGARQSVTYVSAGQPTSHPTTPVSDGASQENESWRRKLEGTSNGMKRSPIRNGSVVADASWIKNKAAPRLMGKKQKQAQIGKPQPLSEEKLKARAADPSAAPTEVMMNLTSYRTELDQKSDFAGAPTEVATNRAIDLNSTADYHDDIDECIDYALQQGKRKRRMHMANMITPQTTNFDSPKRSDQFQNRESITDFRKGLKVDNKHTSVVAVGAHDGRLGRYVGNSPDQVLVTSGSFQSNSLTSSVGVETGGRSIEKAPVALQRVLELTPRRGAAGKWNEQHPLPVRSRASEERRASEVAAHTVVSVMEMDIKPIVSIEQEVLDSALQRVLELSPKGATALDGSKRNNQQPAPVKNCASEERCVADVTPLAAKSVAPRDIKPIASSEEEMLDNNPFLVQYPMPNSQQQFRQQPQTLSPASSGWTPVALSSGGLGDQDDFQSGMVRPHNKGVQPLFSPSRVKNDVMEMMEFGPPMINRTTLLNDEMSPRIEDESISKFESFAELAKEATNLRQPIRASYVGSRASPAQSASRSFSHKQHQRRRLAMTATSTMNRVNPEAGLGDRHLGVAAIGVNSFPCHSLHQSATLLPSPDGFAVQGQSQVLPVRALPTEQSSLVRDRIRNLNKNDPAVLASQKILSVAESPPNVHKWVGRNVEESNKDATTYAGSSTTICDNNLSTAKSLSNARGWDSHVSSVVKTENSSGGSENQQITNNNEKCVLSPVETNVERNSNRVADRYLSSITSPTMPAKLNPIAPDAATGNNRLNNASADFVAGETGENKVNSCGRYRPKRADKKANSSLSKIGSVSMMKSMFEPLQSNTNDTPEDDEISEDNLSVKSIRSIFEADKKAAEKTDDVNAVSKIRSLFEQQCLSQIVKQKKTINNYAAMPYTETSGVQNYGAKSSGSIGATKTQYKENPIKDMKAQHSLVTRSFAPPMQASGEVIASGTPFLSSIGSTQASEGKLVSDHSPLGRQPTIADRIIAMKLERGHPGTWKEKFPGLTSSGATPIKSRRQDNSDIRTPSVGNGENGIEPKEQASHCHDHALLAHDRTSVQDRRKSFALLSRSHNVTAAQRPVLNTPAFRNRLAENDPEVSPAGGNSMRRFHQASTQASSPGNLALSRWGAVSPAKREIYGVDKQGRGASLQGVMGRKAFKTEGARFLDGSNRTDSEGYDDGVTLDLSIADVSVLTNPTCLRSKEDVSIEHASSRKSNVGAVEQEGRGPSEASSSQTSEAAAPLIALAMRARYTNSSDDYGSFALKSFGERLTTGTQSKWVPLTAPIEENEGGADADVVHSSDPAWDLRNIKARFAQRQADRAKTASKRTQRTRKAGGGVKACELDGWEPFKSDQFQATLTTGTGQDDRGKGGHAHVEPRLREKKSRKGLVDAPSTAPTISKSKVKVSSNVLSRDASPRVAHVKENVPKAKADATPYSQQVALMSKLRSLKEARIRRNTAFSRKRSGVPSSRPSCQPQFTIQRQTPYCDMRRGTNADEEEQSAASTLSSTKFGGHRFEDCLNVD